MTLHLDLHTTRLTTFAGMLAFTIASGCDSGGGAPTATNDDYDEVATTMGALVNDRQHGEVASMTEATIIAQGSLPTSFTFDGDIAAGVRLGLAVEYTMTCKDDADRVVSCDESASSASVKASLAGDWSSPRLDASSDFKGDWTFEQLGEPVVIMNGKADSKIDVTVRTDTTTSRWKFAYKVEYDDVGLDSDTRMAVSGTARYDIKTERKVDSAEVDTQDKLSLKGDLTFNADGTATLVLDSKHKYKVKTDGTVVLITRSSTEL